MLQAPVHWVWGHGHAAFRATCRLAQATEEASARKQEQCKRNKRRKTEKFSFLGVSFSCLTNESFRISRPCSGSTPLGNPWFHRLARLTGKCLPYGTPTSLYMCPFTPLLDPFPSICGKWTGGFFILEYKVAASYRSCPDDHAYKSGLPFYFFLSILIN